MNDKIIAMLNDLIETSKDGERGFSLAARDTDEPELNSVFRAGEQSCRSAAAELQDQVRFLGGHAEHSGTLMAAAHRSWISFKSAVSPRDDNAILEERERSEDFATVRYADALKVDMPDSARSIVERQYQGVMLNHGRVRDLRNRYRNKGPRALRSNG